MMMIVDIDVLDIATNHIILNAFLFQTFEDVCEALDEDSIGFLNYKDFMRVFMGEMTERRKVFVRKVRKTCRSGHFPTSLLMSQLHAYLHISYVYI